MNCQFHRQRTKSLIGMELLFCRTNGFFRLDENPYYTVEEDTDGKRPFIKYIYITVHLSYQFEDYTTVPGLRQKFKVDGLMALQRDLNTLIPDEDQQIQW